MKEATEINSHYDHRPPNVEAGDPFAPIFRREFKHAQKALEQAELMATMSLEPEEVLDLYRSVSAIKHIIFWRGLDLGRWPKGD